MTTQPQLWGGLEYTVNRVHDRYGDQIRESGHHDRLDDLDRLAELGLTAIRYPILWERISPDRPDRSDWSWTDERLERLRDLGIDVIAGLVHHGSGPRYTSLVDESFAAGLARHARAAAERYPWIRDWTPVNEPLTTARFSALYGLWYPHQRSERAFWLALLNQIDATRLSMQAIRDVIPTARLIQTDDLGRTYATATLREQAGFDNLRRWAGWDLLCGRLQRTHPLWGRICSFGFEQRLQAIADNPCPPDIVGINHYLTSDRFLDHRLHRYPPHTHGGSEQQLYADVEAVRVLAPSSQGLEGALREAWDRYGLPIAITEVHNGCTREEQMRWIAQAWDIAQELCGQGLPIQAVTIWSMMGSKGWNTLLTGPGAYEPGTWDVSSGSPRATALLPLIRSLPANVERPQMARGAGWWQRPVRLVHPPVARPAPIARHLDGSRIPVPDQPILICGTTGTLGQAMARACALRNVRYRLTSRAELDLSVPGMIEEVIEAVRPWAVVNAAGWVRVDDAESAGDECLKVNADGAIALAAACGSRGIPTLSFSSDLVFDGMKGSAYNEDDPVGPLNAYGRSKVRMEFGISDLPGCHLITRTAAFFSPDDEYNFAVTMLMSLAQGKAFAAADDLIVTPTYVPHLVSAALDLLIDGERGIWHLSNAEAVSWAGFAQRVAQRCGFDPGLIHPVPHASFGWRAGRPVNVALAGLRGAFLPPLDQAIDHFASHLRQDWMRDAAVNRHEAAGELC